MEMITPNYVDCTGCKNYDSEKEICHIKPWIEVEGYISGSVKYCLKYLMPIEPTIKQLKLF